MLPAMLSPPPNLYYICCGFLARAWIVAIVQVVSFNQQQPLLNIFYPVKHSFYLSLILGLPALFTLVLNRYPKRGHRLLHHLVKPLLGIGLVIDIALQIINITSHQFTYSMANALLLTISIWFLLWVITSHRLKYCWKQ